MNESGNGLVYCKRCGRLIGVEVTTNGQTGLLISLADGSDMGLVLYRIHGKCLPCGGNVHWDAGNIVEHRRLRRLKAMV